LAVVGRIKGLAGGETTGYELGTKFQLGNAHWHNS